MKKSILSVFLVSGCFIASFSQGVSGGLRVGMNIANQNQSGSGLSISSDAKIGLMAGAYLTIMASEKFGVQPELVYSQMGASTSILGSTVNNNFNYLSLPVMLRYNVTENFNLQAGPQLGLLLSASQSSGSNSVDIKNQANSIDFGGAFGLGVDFGKFNAAARYYLGFSNLAKDAPSGVSIKGTSIQIMVGYQLFGK
jgi:Outer membrane protein beta-barrel domain